MTIGAVAGTRGDFGDLWSLYLWVGGAVAVLIFATVGFVLVRYRAREGRVPSARELHLHRASLYYRLEKISELADLDLKSGSDRLAAHLSIKALRMAGLLELGGEVPWSGTSKRSARSSPSA